MRRTHALWMAVLLLGALTGGSSAATLPAGVDDAPLLAPMALPESRPLTAPAASVSLSVPGQVPIGQNVPFSVTFDNTGTDPGYGPIIDLILDTTGADGDDGLGTTLISASYLGIPFQTSGSNQNMWVLTFDGFGNATHPLMRDSSGNYIVVTGTPGDKLVVLRLPFGSFTPSQPPATVSVTVNMSNFADIGTPLSIQARGGFEFGATPLDDWCCGDSGDLTLTGFSTQTVTPTLLTLSKSYSGPEDEAASGPNFRTYYPMQYTVTVDIAPGQSLTNFVLNDILPSNLQYYDLIGSSPAGASCAEPTNPPPPPESPGGSLVCSWPPATPVSGTASLSFDFYIPLENASGNPVIDANSGNDVSSCNNASVSGVWNPLDPRDTGDAGPVSESPAGCEHTLTDKSLALQKGVTNLTGGGNSPGDTLEYSLTFQVSDFFAFDGLVISDTISDGQHLSSTPTLAVTGNGFSLPAQALNAANFDVLCDYSGTPGAECSVPDTVPGDSGETLLTLRISDELISRGRPNGRMIGGCVDPAGGSATPECDTGLPGGYNDGPTYATVTFQTTILDNFVDDYPSGDASVDQGDVLGNTATITGDLLNTDDFSPTGFDETDGSAAGVSIGTGTLSKTIYAINDSTSFSSPVEVKPGDKVTYRITYTLPTSDEENLELTDYLPLPIFHVGDPNEDGSPGPAWSFDPTVSSASPAAGVAKFGPADTFYSYTCDPGGTPAGCLAPTLTSDTPNNSLNFYYGDFNDPRHLPTTVDLLFSVLVSDDPFADRLYLTNQVHGFEGSTNAGTVAGDDIVQIILTEPVLLSNKAVIWTSNPNAVFNPPTTGPVTFLDRSNSPRYSSTINSTNLASSPIDSNVSFVDAGDIVTFAIVIENTGSSLNGAFDLVIRDDLPAEFQVPADATGLNLQVYYGDPAFGAIGFNGLGGGPDAINGTDDDLFGSGIELIDPVGSGVCQVHDPNLGNNIILITFDLQLRDNVTPGTIINTESLVSYAGSEGGPNHLPTPQTDTAETSVNGVLAKTLDSSEIEHADNTPSEVVIGEFATYTVTVDVPEGQMPGAAVLDTLDSGLTFLDCLSITASPAVSTSIGVGDFSEACSTFISPAVVSPGTSIRFNLGTLTNSDRDNSVTEQIAITYRVVTLNTSGNQAGTTLNNSAVLSWTGGSLPAVGAPNVTVIEPVLNVAKSVVVNGSGTAGDAGDPLVYTITVQHTGTSNADAFDVSLSDDLPVASPGGPSLIDGASLVSVSDTASVLGLADFTLTGSDATGYTLSTVTPFDFTLTPPAGPTPRILTFTISGSLAVAVEPGSFDNTARVTWTSLDGVPAPSPRSPYNTNATERTGSGVGPNDYFHEASATVNVIATPGKSIVSTSEAHTGFDGTRERLAIGEIVRYRISVDIPEGTSTNLQLRDQLPQGLLLQDLDQVMLSFTADNNITEAADLAGADNDAVPPTFVLPASRIATSFASNRQTVTFSLGNLVNNDSDPGAEMITLEFNALVDNSSTGSNDAGDNRNNAFSLLINGSVVSTSSTVNARISEPSITNVNKTASPTSGDAGDLIGYTVTFSNANGANNTTAFDLVLSDSLPADMTLSLASLSVSSAGSCAVGIDTSNSTGNTVDVRIASVPAGCAVTVTYNAVLDSTVTAAQVLANTAALTYTSLPGPNGTSGNPTGSTTPGGSGSTTGERNGSGGINDYADSDGVSVTVPEVVPVKSIVGSSDANTSGSDLAIGEVVRYRLAVTIPEGTSLAFTLTDTLPAGFTYAGTPKLSFLADSDMTETVDLAGADNDALPPTFDLPAGRASVVGQNVTFSLGDLVNNDSDLGSETVVLEFDALVNNSANNQNTNLKNNVFSVSINAVNRGSSNIVTATIVEPQLTIAKAALDDTPALGATVTYQITIANPSASSDAIAYDVVVTDIIPGTAPELTYVGPVLPLPAGWSLDDSAAPTLVFSAAQLALDESVTLEYQVTLGVPPDVLVGDTFNNTATATWTSLSGPNADERTGADGVGGALNDYAAESSETITASEVDVTLTKDDGILSAVPGQNVTYSLTITNLGNVDAAGVSVTDTVPDYTTFAGPSGPAAWDCAIGAAAGSACTYDVGALAAGASTAITFSVDVINPLPVLVDLTTNDASVSATNEPALLNGNNSATHDTPLVAAPDLVILKDDGVDTVSPGTLLLFTLTYSNEGDQDASGVEITDVVPANTTFVPASSTPGWTCDDPDGGGPLNPGDPTSTCTFTIGNRAADGAQSSITFALRVDDPFPIGVNLVTNTAEIADDGANGADQNPGDNQDTDSDNVVTLGNLDINKNLVATSQGHTDPGDTLINGNPPVAIGEILTYEILLNIPPGTITGVEVLDILDPGLSFVDCLSSTPSSANLVTSLGSFSAACDPDPLAPASGNPQILPEPSGSIAVVDQGRRILFSLGDVSNTNGFGGSDETLTIRYQVVVLDSNANLRGVRLNNAVAWSWDSGDLAEAANEVEIAEPTLSLTKDADPRIVPPGAPITFTLTVQHTPASDTTAFDLVLTDTLPPELTYVPGTLACTSGACSEAAGVITVTWDSFGLAETSVITFDATLGALSPGQRVANEASLEWTSLPDDDVSIPYSLSPYNALAVERRYDPNTPVDIYQVLASVLVGTPELPETGFAPGRLTHLPPAPSGAPYSNLGDLQLEIPALGLRSSIVGVATDESGWDLTWLWNNVGYLQGTAYPTHAGNTVLTGHVVLPSGLPGPFAKLGDLFWGDTVLLHSGEITYVYEVRERWTILPDDLSVMKHETLDWVTLITCRSYDPASGTYLRRTVLRAVLVDVR